MKEHLDEVDSLEADIEKVWELFHKNSHQRSAAPPASPAAARRPSLVTNTGPQIKLIPEFKPAAVPHNTSAEFG